jgi:hypothetical protein
MAYQDGDITFAVELPTCQIGTLRPSSSLAGSSQACLALHELDLASAVAHAASVATSGRADDAAVKP